MFIERAFIKGMCYSPEAEAKKETEEQARDQQLREPMAGPREDVVLGGQGHL